MDAGVKVIAIAAVARNGVIGKENGLPWSIPEDLRFFRDSTRGQVVIMGRKTYESLGRALPKRENAVITRNPAWTVPDAKVFQDLRAAIEHYRSRADLQGQSIFVIGGAEIYTLSIPFLDEIWLTEIDAEFSGDTRFPAYDAGMLRIPGFSEAVSSAQKEPHPDGIHYRFVTYRRSS